MKSQPSSPIEIPTRNDAGTVQLINPKTGNLLVSRMGGVYDPVTHQEFPLIEGVMRFAGANYSDSFGFQWNRFRSTQLDNEHVGLSRERFFAETEWLPEDMDGKHILEVGSGAGRFSRVVLRATQATLWSVDYSDAVVANWASNGEIAPDRFRLFQASIYELPFPDDSFDKVFCFGVLQHTPDFEASVRALVSKAKPGGEVVVDFYPIRGWWTKIHAKYLFRHFTRQMRHERLLSLIEANIDWLIKVFDALVRIRLGVLTRFLPITDLRGFPKGLTVMERREWAVLDTFDGFSPEFDNPQRLQDVSAMFERAGARIRFAGLVGYGGGSAMVVRAVKPDRCSEGSRAGR